MKTIVTFHQLMYINYASLEPLPSGPYCLDKLLCPILLKTVYVWLRRTSLGIRNWRLSFLTRPYASEFGTALLFCDKARVAKSLSISSHCITRTPSHLALTCTKREAIEKEKLPRAAKRNSRVRTSKSVKVQTMSFVIPLYIPSEVITNLARGCLYLNILIFGFP